MSHALVLMGVPKLLENPYPLLVHSLASMKLDFHELLLNTVTTEDPPGCLSLGRSLTHNIKLIYLHIRTIQLLHSHGIQKPVPHKLHS